jgi:hypothetical protein
MNGSIFHFHLSSHKKTRKILLLITSRPPLRLEETVADWLDWPLPWPAVLLRHSFTPSLSLSSFLSFFFREAIIFCFFSFFFLSVSPLVVPIIYFFLLMFVFFLFLFVLDISLSVLYLTFCLYVFSSYLSFVFSSLFFFLLLKFQIKLKYLAHLLHYVHNSTEFKIQPLCVCVHACAPDPYISTRKVIVVKQFVM